MLLSITTRLLRPHEEIARSVDVLHSTGTGRFYPTVITARRDGMLGSLRNLARAKEALPSIEGFHVEGPHICPDEGPRGAHPVQWVRRPDIDEYRTLAGSHRRSGATGHAVARMAGSAAIHRNAW